MDKQIVNSLVSIVNGLECSLVRNTFLDLQNDENSTNEQLVQDAVKWNSYLDAYCLVYREIHKDIPVH